MLLRLNKRLIPGIAAAVKQQEGLALDDQVQFTSGWISCRPERRRGCVRVTYVETTQKRFNFVSLFVESKSTPNGCCECKHYRRLCHENAMIDSSKTTSRAEVASALNCGVFYHHRGSKMQTLPALDSQHRPVPSTRNTCNISFHQLPTPDTVASSAPLAHRSPVPSHPIKISSHLSHLI